MHSDTNDISMKKIRRERHAPLRVEVVYNLYYQFYLKIIDCIFEWFQIKYSFRMKKIISHLTDIFLAFETVAAF